MQTFSYLPSATLRTFGAVCSRKAPRSSIGGSTPWSKIRVCVRSRMPMMWTLDDDLVARVELEDLGLVGDREGDLVACHQASRSNSTSPLAETWALARRAAQHW